MGKRQRDYFVVLWCIAIGASFFPTVQISFYEICIASGQSHFNINGIRFTAFFLQGLRARKLDLQTARRGEKTH